MPSTQFDNTANAGKTTAKPSASSNMVAPLPSAVQTGEVPFEIVDTPASDLNTPSTGHNPDSSLPPRHVSPSKPSPVYDFSAVEDASERDWWAKGFKYLKDAGLGDLWNGTVDAFYEHEELMEFGVHLFFHPGFFSARSFSDQPPLQYFRIQYLPKKTRPKEVSDWIQSARPFNHKSIGNLPDFETRIRDWWWQIQPQGRTRGENGWPLQQDDAAVDWEKARFSGLNGMWSIMIALCWWGVSLQTDSTRDGSDWKLALYDVRYVLWRLVETAPAAFFVEDESISETSKSLKSTKSVIMKVTFFLAFSLQK